MAGKATPRRIMAVSGITLVLTVFASVIVGRLFPQLGMWAQVICVAIGSGIVVPMWIEYMNRSRER